MFSQIASSVLFLSTLTSALPVMKRAPVEFNNFQLKVYSADPAVDGLFVTPYHEGAGFNTAFAISSSTSTYNLTGGALLANIPGTLVYNGEVIPTNEEATLNSLQFNIDAGATGFSFDESGFLQYNQSHHWLSCHNIGDPYNYPEASIAFQVGSIPGNCEAAFIVKV
ncbi:hypothetical protein AWJ20_452 [Sugiyamaella lignohabitans]|uniref:DUF7907 domain-containing protein n=1 Tax=Sugiyamaella lignohabitans TaxID=796027 RepID=A0A161HKH8_9ASCO|nr:uncharacterized protein AWJ20_452 [Sugiyamaella lignohabitans]ANB12208.1 hypothetical protein AWJ20_452 [Sugiyamaella lignohabitans]